MDEDDLAELAKGMAPYVRECVAQALCDVIIVPPELAAQVASAVRMLHEAPEPKEKAAPRIARVERDEQGNLVPVYDE